MLAAMLASLVSTQSLAKGGGVHKFSLFAELTRSEIKSKMVGNNDSAAGQRFGIAVNGGKANNFGMMLRQEDVAVDFELNKSKIETSAQTVYVRGRLFEMLQIGFTLTDLTMRVKSSAVNYTAQGEVLGFNGGFNVGLGRAGAIFTDVQYNMETELNEIANQKVSIVSQLDYEGGISIAVLKKYLDALISLRSQSITYKVGKKSFDDETFTVIIGVHTGFDP